MLHGLFVSGFFVFNVLARLEGEVKMTTVALTTPGLTGDSEGPLQPSRGDPGSPHGGCAPVPCTGSHSANYEV